MAVVKDLWGNRYTMHLSIIKLVCWLGWFSCIAFGQLQLSETLTGSVSFPDLGITCIGNIAVFFTSIVRGKLELEIGAKDVLSTLRSRKLKNINGLEDLNWFGLTTCRERPLQRSPPVRLMNPIFDRIMAITHGLRRSYVLMLSKHAPNSSMRQFMEYISNVYDVQSIFLQFLPLESVAVTTEICSCSETRRCTCIVFCTTEEITIMLAERMPGTIKQLSVSLCLLPSKRCLSKGCHGCRDGMLHVERSDEFPWNRLIEGVSSVEFHAAVCSIIDQPSEWMATQSCICIPLNDSAGNDEWTKLLIRCLKSKENEARGISFASHALENYMAGNGICHAVEEYDTTSILVPRMTEVMINIALTFWFKVDGFSSALVARRAIKEYVVDSKGIGFAANVFLTQVRALSDDNNTNVCQVLSFRGNFVTLRTLSLIVGCVNLSCALSWAVLVALEGGPSKWYDSHSTPPTKPRVTVIMAAIGIALGMDFVDLYSYMPRGRLFRRQICMVCALIMFEIVCILSSSTVMKTLGIKGFGRWIYSVVHGLVWVKWVTGSFLLDQRSPLDGRTYDRSGMYVYASAFFLNAILAGVRANWAYS